MKLTDVVSAEVRSRMMSAIRGKNTKPELSIRGYLHSCGYRFRLHRKDLPGKPDIVLPKYRLAIFVHGCFWHRHEGCFYCSIPSTREEFWSEKFKSNVVRDSKNVRRLIGAGWRVLVIWECGVKHLSDDMSEVIDVVESSRAFSVWPAEPPRVSRVKN
nr:very short patch repair endonuclease [Pseudomonas cichorii]